MKTLKLFTVALLSTYLITSCNKPQETPIPSSNNIKQSDQSGSDEVDAALQNVNNLISDRIGGGLTQHPNQKVSAVDLPCGVVKFDTLSLDKKYNVDFGDKTPCGLKYLSGDIGLSLTSGNKFGDVGAQYSITFTDYVTQAKATGAIVKLNGTLTITNVNGGYIWETVTSDATIVHTIGGSLDITYSNGKKYPRNYSQKRTWDATKDNWASISLTITGDDTNGSVSETGKTYDGNYDFTTVINTGFKWENCGSNVVWEYRLTSGKATISIPSVLSSIVVEGGYVWTSPSVTPKPSTTACDANTYKITTTIGASSPVVTYQLY